MGGLVITSFFYLHGHKQQVSEKPDLYGTEKCQNPNAQNPNYAEI